MAAAIGALHVDLTANSAAFGGDMARARRHVYALQAQFRQLRTAAVTSGLGMDQFARRVGIGRAALSALGVGLGVKEVLGFADAWTRVNNSLKVAGTPADKLQSTMDRLFEIAQRSGAAIEPTVQLFARLSQSATELGASQEQLFAFTSGIGDALKVAGVDAQSASGALLQLSQAMGSAYVRAEEFNSINEGARPILQAVADGNEKAAGSVSKLRAMVIAGTLTSHEFFESFLRGSESLRTKAASATDTVSMSVTKLNNSLTRMFGEMDKGLGVTGQLSGLMSKLADAIDRIPGFVGTGEIAEMNRQFREDIAAGISEQEAWQRLLDRAQKNESTRRFGMDLDELNAKAAQLRQELTAVMADPQLTVSPWVKALQDQLEEVEAQIARVSANLRGALGVASGALSGAGAVGASGNMPAATQTTTKPGTGRSDASDVVADLRFEQQQLSRTSAEQAIYNQLKAAGVTLASAQGREIAQLVTEIEKERLAQQQKQDWDETVASVNERIGAMQLEISMFGKSTEAIERARTALELENEAKRLGLTITPNLRDQIDQLAGAYGRLAGQAETAQLSAAKLQEIRDIGRDAFRGLAEAMREGKLRGEEFLDVLGRIADRLFDLAADGLFDLLLGGGSGSKNPGGLAGGFLCSGMGE